VSICTASVITGTGGVAGGGDSVVFSTNATSTSTGVPVIRIISGVESTIQVTLSEDVFGEIPADINQDSVTLVVKEHKETPNTVYKGTVPVTSGTATVSISHQDFPKSGLYPMAFIVHRGDVPVAEYQGYLYVETGLNTWTDVSNDPISISDVRMALMDYSPEANTLLEELEFSDLQIIAAMKRPIREWNETPPDIGTYNFNNFPYHEAWLKATCSYLLESAAHRYNRNTIPHNASGLTMDPNNKGNLYMSSALALRQEWKAWIMAKKTELNMLSCWGATSISIFDNTNYYDY
jgi:hypothetical protein